MVNMSEILRQDVLGSRRFSNYFWALVVSMGGVGFLLSGLSSYLKTNLLIVSDVSNIQFFPQGIALFWHCICG